MSDEELVRRYLLGDLPGDEQEAFETRLLSEDDLFELTEALEAEVLEDYARGGLAPAQRERVEGYLAASPEGRLRLAVVRGLSAMATSATSAGRSGRLLQFPGPAAGLERPKVRPQAIAALFVMAVGAALLAGIHLQPLEPKPRLPEPASKGPGTIAQSTPAPRIAPLATPVPAPAPTPILFVADIALSALRGDEEIPSFDIPASTDIVELRLKLPEGDQGYPSYQVAVRQDATGEEVTGNEGLRIKQSNGRLILRLEARRFEEGRYSLTVQGVTSEGEVEDLAYPEFEVRYS
jgi:hypothetical protein